MVRHSVAGENGQAIIFLALLMAAMLGMLGLIVDGGMLLTERRGAQSAADAAAMAAAQDLKEGVPAASAVISALYYAARNGYGNDGITNGVTVSIPPTSGPYAGDAGYVGVAVTKTLSTFFIQVVFGGKSTAEASSTAKVVTGPAPYAVIALNQTACEAIDIWGSADVMISGGGMLANSSCAANAFSFEGNSNVQVTAGGAIDTNGGYEIEGSASVSPLPVTGVAQITDPLTDLPAPSLGGLSVRHGTAENPSTLLLSGNADYTLWPGIYYGGISIQGNANVTFTSGTHVLAGGGLTFTGNGRVVGEGVTIYNTRDPSFPFNDGAYGSITLTGNGEVSLSPPTSGTYDGLLFFQDRSNTQTYSISGNGSIGGYDRELAGTMYFPSAMCDFDGNGYEAAIQQLICDTIDISGNGDLDVQYEVENLHAVSSATLVE